MDARKAFGTHLEFVFALAIANKDQVRPGLQPPESFEKQSGILFFLQLSGKQKDDGVRVNPEFLTPFRCTTVLICGVTPKALRVHGMRSKCDARGRHSAPTEVVPIVAADRDR